MPVIPFFIAATALHSTTLVDTIPLSVNASPFQQSIALPQFNPALGSLTDAKITIAGSLQDVVEIVNSGPGRFDVTLEDFISLGSLPATERFPLGGFIPANTPVFGVPFPVTPFSVSTSLNGQLADFTGPGSISFLFQVLNPITQIVEGPTITSVFGTTSLTGNIALDYTYTPVAPAPEPSTIIMLSIGMFFTSICCAHRLRRLRSGWRDGT